MGHYKLYKAGCKYYSAVFACFRHSGEPRAHLEWRVKGESLWHCQEIGWQVSDQLQLGSSFSCSLMSVYVHVPTWKVFTYVSFRTFKLRLLIYVTTSGPVLSLLVEFVIINMHRYSIQVLFLSFSLLLFTRFFLKQSDDPTASWRVCWALCCVSVLVSLYIFFQCFFQFIEFDRSN